MSAIEITSAFTDPRLRSGVTQTNRDRFPLPGLTFSTSNDVSVALVGASRAALALEIGTEPDQLQFMRQVHGATVVRIDHCIPPPEADALITNVPGIVLCATIADCCAVLLYDADHQAVAAVHSGWRGTQANIVAAAVQAMTETYESDPRRLTAFLSPCASVDRYEVGDDVAAFFPDHIRRTDDGTTFFDNHSAIRAALEATGIPASHILADPTCTMIDLRYHSHRREGSAAGRGVGFIGIR
jgi:YfiH family protein